MGTYYTALQTTTRINNGAKVFDIIKSAAKSYTNYGWYDDIQNTTNLYQVADVFGILTHLTDDGIIPILNDTYGSAIWYEVLPKIAPYMENGYISGLDSDGEPFNITFDDGKCIINGNILLGVSHNVQDHIEIYDTAARVYNLDLYEAQDNGESVESIAGMVENDPAIIIDYLLDIIDELQA